MGPEILVLRLIHIVGGIFWTGAVLFTTLFLMPTLATMGPAAGQVMLGMQKRKLFTVLPIVAMLTVLSGLRLIWITSGGLSAAYFATGTGKAFAAGGVFALVAFVIGLAVVRPAGERMAKITALLGGADEPTRAKLMAEMAIYRRRNVSGSNVVATLLAVSAVCMAVARYAG